MKILGLDQATTTGFAVAESGAIVESGTWELADRRRTGESRGMRYVRFRQALAEVFGRHPDIRLIVHEQTLLRGGAATEIANGLKALILETAVNKGVEVSCVHTTELKKWATGSGRAGKAAMVEACRRRSGRDPRDDNEADAILIALWGAETLGTEGFGPLPAAARGGRGRPGAARLGLTGFDIRPWSSRAATAKQKHVYFRRWRPGRVFYRSGQRRRK